MSKAILVIEAEKSCHACDISFVYHGEMTCHFITPNVDEYTTSRHPDCPLKIIEDPKPGLPALDKFLYEVASKK